MSALILTTTCPAQTGADEQCDADLTIRMDESAGEPIAIVGCEHAAALLDDARFVAEMREALVLEREDGARAAYDREVDRRIDEARENGGRPRPMPRTRAWRRF